MKKEPAKKRLNPAKKRKLILKGLALMLIVTILNALGQLGFKIGVDNYSTFWGLITNYPLLIGLAVYGISMILFTYALRFAELHIIYPFLSLTFIWVLILSSSVLNEPIALLDFAGVVMIIGGVSLIGYSQ